MATYDRFHKQSEDLEDFTRKTLAVTLDKAQKGLADSRHRLLKLEGRQDEVEKAIPLVVKARIGEMMKLHLADLDGRKVDVEVFQLAIKGKADQVQVKDVRRQLDSYHNTVDMLLAEVKAKLDLLNRDQSRTITIDTFAESYAPYLAKAEHLMNVERSLAMTLEQLIGMQKQNKMYRADFDERLARL